MLIVGYHLSNIHLDTSSYKGPRDRENVDYVFLELNKQIQKDIRRRNTPIAPMVVIAGDLLQHCSELRKWDLADAIKYLKTFGDLPVIIIPGDCDHVGDVDLLEQVIKAANLPNIYYFAGPTIATINIPTTDGATCDITISANNPDERSPAKSIAIAYESKNNKQIPQGNYAAIMMGGRRDFTEINSICAFPGLLVQKSNIAGYIRWEISEKNTNYRFQQVIPKLIDLVVKYANDQEISTNTPGITVGYRNITLCFNSCSREFVKQKYAEFTKFVDVFINVVDDGDIKSRVEKAANILRDIPALFMSICSEITKDPEHIQAISALYKQHCDKLGIAPNDPCEMTRRPTRFNLTQMAFNNLMVYGTNNSVELPEVPGSLIGINAANGVGKSTFITALTLVLYGKAERGDNKSLIRNGCDAMNLHAEIHTNGMLYEIERIRTKNNSSELIRYGKYGNSELIDDGRPLEIQQNEQSAYNLLFDTLPTISRPKLITVDNSAGVSQITSKVVGDYELAVYSCIAQQKTQYDLLRCKSAQQKAILQHFMGLEPILRLKQEADAHLRAIDLQIKMLNLPCVETSEQLTLEYNELVKKSRVINAQISQINQRIKERSFVTLAVNPDKYNREMESMISKIIPNTLLMQIWPELRKIQLDYTDYYTNRDELMNNIRRLEQFYSSKLMPHNNENLEGRIVESLKYIKEHSDYECLIGNQDKLKSRFDELTNELFSGSKPLENMKSIDKSRQTITELLLQLTKYQDIINKLQVYGGAMINRDKLALHTQAIIDYDATYVENAAASNKRALEQELSELQAELHELTNKDFLSISVSITRVFYKRKERIEFEEKLEKLRQQKRIATFYRQIYHMGLLDRLLEVQIPLLEAEINRYLIQMEANFLLSIKYINGRLFLNIRKAIIEPDDMTYIEEPVYLTGGYQYDLINALMRIALWRLYRGPLPNFLVFDETFAQADSTNLQKLLHFMRNMDNPPQFIMINSHNTDILNILDYHLTISHDLNRRISCIKNCERVLEIKKPATEIIADINNQFTQIGDKMMCIVCKKELSNLRHILFKHVNSTLHKKNKTS